MKLQTGHCFGQDAPNLMSKKKARWLHPGEPFSLATTMETWRPIPGSTYEASSLGRIRSPWGTILKPCNHGLGYHIVGVRFHDRAKIKTVTVHTLVAAAFHGPRPAGLDVAHGDNDKHNNRPENLRYATRSENMKDSPKSDGKKSPYPWKTLDVGDVFQMPRVRRGSASGLCRVWSLRLDQTFKALKPANDDGSWTVTRVA